MNLSNITIIKEIINDYGLSPSSLNGQNFLVDAMVLQTIIEAAAIKPGENILEIGPGLGVLTAELLMAGAKVMAVEKDRRIFFYLKKRFKGEDALVLVNDDIIKFEDYPQPYRIVANIPYSLTAKIIKKFTSDAVAKPGSMLVMVQKEVGERVCAQPGRLNLLAICAQLYGEPSIVATVPAKAFYPAPKVDSCLLLIDNIQAKTPHRIPDLPKFWRVLHIGFSSPRKQLHNNLMAGLKLSTVEVKELLSSLKINIQARAQELSIGQWVKLSEILSK
ncbi:MAG: 16S rRNA (adenine(1518)-N(6)/adenine(1519)-N(6))-dimethyltransferase RsmA [Patescibacteria group bacterium]